MAEFLMPVVDAGIGGIVAQIVHEMADIEQQRRNDQPVSKSLIFREQSGLPRMTTSRRQAAAKA